MRGADGQARQVTHLNESISKYGLDRPDFLQIKILRCVEIEARLAEPSGYDGNSKRPTIVWCMAGPPGKRATPWMLGPIARGLVGTLFLSERASARRLRQNSWR